MKVWAQLRSAPLSNEENTGPDVHPNDSLCRDDLNNFNMEKSLPTLFSDPRDLGSVPPLDLRPEVCGGNRL